MPEAKSRFSKLIVPKTDSYYCDCYGIKYINNIFS